MKRLPAVFALTVIVLSVGSVAAGSATTQDPTPYAFLAHVRIGGDEWRIFVVPGGKGTPCVGEGFSPGGPGVNYVDPICGIPKFSYPFTDARGVERFGRRPKSVLALALPKDAVRVHLDLGEYGERDLPLKLLSRRQSHKAKVERFRWGYLKIVGESCLREVVGYDKGGQVVDKAIDEGSGCDPLWE